MISHHQPPQITDQLFLVLNANPANKIAAKNQVQLPLLSQGYQPSDHINPTPNVKLLESADLLLANGWFDSDIGRQMVGRLG
jgi:hypothetical protein